MITFGPASDSNIAGLFQVSALCSVCSLRGHVTVPSRLKGQMPTEEQRETLLEVMRANPGHIRQPDNTYAICTHPEA